MAQLRRMLLLAVTAALLVAGSAGSAAAAQPHPTIFAEVEYCEPENPYGSWFHVVGLEPNTEYLFLYLPVGSGGHWFTTDGAGARFDVGGSHWDRPFETGARISLDPNHNGVVDANESVAVEQHFRFARPCELPVPPAKADCQKGGWRSFSRFKGQGQCIRFVKQGSRN
jgi:hypothetical protein